MMSEYPKIQMTWSRKDTFDGTVSNITVRGETVDECSNNLQLALQEAKKINATPSTAPAVQAPYRSNQSETGQVAGGVGNVGMCPECGKPLVERVNKVKGTTFIGCSGFPACKYIKH